MQTPTAMLATPQSPPPTSAAIEVEESSIDEGGFLATFLEIDPNTKAATDDDAKDVKESPDTTNDESSFDIAPDVNSALAKDAHPQGVPPSDAEPDSSTTDTQQKTSDADGRPVEAPSASRESQLGATHRQTDAPDLSRAVAVPADHGGNHGIKTGEHSAIATATSDNTSFDMLARRVAAQDAKTQRSIPEPLGASPAISQAALQATSGGTNNRQAPLTSANSVGEVSVATPDLAPFRADAVSVTGAQDVRPNPQTATTLAAAAPDMASKVARQMAETVEVNRSGVTELRLSPEELGRVRISISGTDGTAQISVVAERPETLELMRRNIAQLHQEFRNAGFRDLSFAFGSETGQGTSGNPAADRQGNTREGADEASIVDTSPSASRGQILRLAGGGLDIRL